MSRTCQRYTHARTYTYFSRARRAPCACAVYGAHMHAHAHTHIPPYLTVLSFFLFLLLSLFHPTRSTRLRVASSRRRKKRTVTVPRGARESHCVATPRNRATTFDRAKDTRNENLVQTDNEPKMVKVRDSS